jgi:hypothetical protein
VLHDSSLEWACWVLEFLLRDADELVAKGGLHSASVFRTMVEFLRAKGTPFKHRVIALLTQLLKSPMLFGPDQLPDLSALRGIEKAVMDYCEVVPRCGARVCSCMRACTCACVRACVPACACACARPVGMTACAVVRSLWCRARWAEMPDPQCSPVACCRCASALPPACFLPCAACCLPTNVSTTTTIIGTITSVTLPVVPAQLIELLTTARVSERVLRDARFTAAGAGDDAAADARGGGGAAVGRRRIRATDSSPLQPPPVVSRPPFDTHASIRRQRLEVRPCVVWVCPV